MFAKRIGSIACIAVLRATLMQMIEESGADGLMIEDLVADPAARSRSDELLAETLRLEPRPIRPTCHSGPMTFENYFEIVQTIARYGHTLDSADVPFDAI